MSTLQCVGRCVANAMTGGVLACAFALTARAATYTDRQLSMRAANAPRQEVRRTVAERTGSRIDGIDLASGTVTLDRVSLRAELQALVGDLPYSLTESVTRPDGSVRYGLQIRAVAGEGTIPAPPDVATMTSRPVAAPSVSDIRGSPAIDWHEQRLTVHVRNAERSAVLREISRLTQTAVEGLGYVTGTVTMDLAETSLRSALQALIGNFSYALIEFGRVDAGEQPHYAIRINGPMPPRPEGLPHPAPGQPGWSVDTTMSPDPMAPGSRPLPPTNAEPVARPPGPPSSAPGQPWVPTPPLRQ